jgi:hypothetical protein
LSVLFGEIEGVDLPAAFKAVAVVAAAQTAKAGHVHPKAVKLLHGIVHHRAHQPAPLNIGVDGDIAGGRKAEGHPAHKGIKGVNAHRGDKAVALKNADVLYIDDLFKNGKDDFGTVKQPTPADINAAFEIINYRYNNPGKITIISSERTLIEMNAIDEAIAGRIAEKSKAGGYCINLAKDGKKNWRMKGITEL